MKVYISCFNEDQHLGILGVSTTMSLALGICKLHENAWVEEDTVDVFSPNVTKGWRAYWVSMQRDGTCINVERALRVSRAGYIVEGTVLYATVYAASEDDAKELTDELRVNLIASNQWNIKPGD